MANDKLAPPNPEHTQNATQQNQHNRPQPHESFQTLMGKKATELPYKSLKL